MGIVGDMGTLGTLGTVEALGILGTRRWHHSDKVGGELERQLGKGKGKSEE